MNVAVALAVICLLAGAFWFIHKTGKDKVTVTTSLASSSTTSNSSGTPSPTSNRTTTPGCQRLTGVRLPGGGHQQGNQTADQILPYPYVGTSLADCEQSCLSKPECKQYVSTTEGNQCYQMNKKFTYDPVVNADQSWVSGFCH